GLQTVVAAEVEAPAGDAPIVPDLLSIEVEPPQRADGAPRLYDRGRVRSGAGERNYLEIEARNRSLGRAGEELILRFEHERLWRVGKRDLAERIEHVAVTKGDGLGYDIRSFEADGRDRLIEVKTTRFGPMTPFFVSRNEVEVSEAVQRDYRLCRVFGFRERPRLFTLAGSLQGSCELEASVYAAVPR
ncbi:MAG: DUF3883 domain-containing protein, partial [Limisphaerales bacterium]